MMVDVLNHLQKKLREEQQLMSEALAKGTAKDYAEYREMCGVVRGFIVAQNLVAEMAERIEESE
jgi:hypothetical protein